MTYPLTDTTPHLGIHPAAHNAWVDPIVHYGAEGDGATDDTDAINSANTAAGSTGTLFLQPGKTFKVTDNLNPWKCNVIGSGATINSTITDGAAVTIGDGTSNTADSKTIHLPDITQNSRIWSSSVTGTDVGLKMWAAVNSYIYIGKIRDFTVGALAQGGTSASPSSPFAYNSVFIRDLNNNKVNLRIDDGGTSYANENVYYGGRYSHGGSMGTGISGCRHIEILKTGTNTPNSHRFIAASLEGDSFDYTVFCQGASNLWLHCRWEAAAEAICYDGANSANNVVAWGPYAGTITYTLSNGGGVRYQALTQTDWSLSTLLSLHNTGYMQLAEMTEPSAPAANYARLYSKDVNGKTALFARFATGASQQIAIEP